MLNDFIDEVISRGAEAVLPQNLTLEWLDELYAAAVDFLRDVIGDGAADPVDEDLFEDETAMMMLAAVMEIIQYQRGYPPEMPELGEGELFEPLSCYALSVVLEYISRKAPIEMEPPTVDNIFDRERIMAFEAANPDVTSALNMLVNRSGPAA